MTKTTEAAARIEAAKAEIRAVFSNERAILDERITPVRGGIVFSRTILLNGLNSAAGKVFKSHISYIVYSRDGYWEQVDALNFGEVEIAEDTPAYTDAVWVDGRVANKGELPLWSGKKAPPMIGSIVICNDRKATRVTVTGYAVEGDWLMVQGYRTDDPDVRGNLAGAEIR